ncbi:SOS response-associated peptidase [Pseudonocardia spinosispora]|uniref:SOS response-associated peptidase n=1 Tax=Pseudonocardia spinosispora TaxID=103441 RepID=UPI00042A3F59|nr:SOS response-associated peptidase [Pseudonocardia spinosispora]
MCGRYASTKSAADIADEFQAVDATQESTLPVPGADYNVAPTKSVLSVVARHPRDSDGKADPNRTVRSVRVMRWGLVPSWAKDPSIGNRMINARSETADEKPAYRKAVVSRRCLLPAEGWYEWRREGKAKQPYFVTGTDGASLAMAGLWEFWRPKDGGEPLVTAAVLTTAAIGPLTDIHDRMPLLVPSDHWETWLNPDLGPDADELAALLHPSEDDLTSVVDRMELRPVSSKVNNVRNEGPALLERVDLAAPVEEQKTLALDLNG